MSTTKTKAVGCTPSPCGPSLMDRIIALKISTNTIAGIIGLKGDFSLLSDKLRHEPCGLRCSNLLDIIEPIAAERDRLRESNAELLGALGIARAAIAKVKKILR